MMPTQPPATSARTSIHDNVLISDVAGSVSKMTLAATTTTRRVHQGGGMCSRCGLYKTGGLYKDYCSVYPPPRFARLLVCRQCITATREHNTTPPQRNDQLFQRTKVYGALLPATLKCSMCHVRKDTATEFTRKEKKKYYCAEEHILCFTCHRIQCKNAVSRQFIIKKETKRIRKEQNRALKRNETTIATTTTMSPCAAPHQDRTRLAATIKSISKNNNYYYHQDRTTYYHPPAAAAMYYPYNPHYSNNNAPPTFTKTPTYYSNNNNTFATTTTMPNHDGGSAGGGGWDAATAALRQHNAAV